MNLAYTMQGTEILSSKVYCTYVPFNERIISFYIVYKVQHTVKLRYLKLDGNV